mmetsp:Transcript_12092/g.37439  ORF Transcript_12092/g.37439 Transcript_12092/m.37439 type:complete len:254 (-) Transcript_12092:137-898(-)
MRPLMLQGTKKRSTWPTSRHSSMSWSWEYRAGMFRTRSVVSPGRSERLWPGLGGPRQGGDRPAPAEGPWAPRSPPALDAGGTGEAAAGPGGWASWPGRVGSPGGPCVDEAGYPRGPMPSAPARNLCGAAGGAAAADGAVLAVSAAPRRKGRVSPVLGDSCARGWRAFRSPPMLGSPPHGSCSLVHCKGIAGMLGGGILGSGTSVGSGACMREVESAELWHGCPRLASGGLSRVRAKTWRKAAILAAAKEISSP